MNVVVVDYDPQWARDFELLRARIWRVVQDLAVSIEHVGSTSVPGLAAKPILDIDVVVRSEQDLVLTIERLATIDYTHRGNLGIEGREAFRAAVNVPAHNLYACRMDSAALQDHLMFRDFLRTHPDTAQGYAELKRHLARQFPDDVDSYATAKTHFVLDVLGTAGIPHARIDQIRRENGLS
jgi:GrpB-like predicted nucleotidyltransferase (UPF0157 family)